MPPAGRLSTSNFVQNAHRVNVCRDALGAGRGDNRGHQCALDAMQHVVIFTKNLGGTQRKHR